MDAGVHSGGGNQRELFKSLNLTGQLEVVFTLCITHNHAVPFSPYEFKVFQTVRTHMESGGCIFNLLHTVSQVK